MLITILTPTYNRKKEIKNLYKSLLTQTQKNFEWIVIDDGSVDDTKEYINGLVKEKKIDIKYIYQKNGGKHTALNTGIEECSGKLTFIVDSDDILTNKAIEEINNEWGKIKDKNLCGISFLRGYSEEKAIGDEFYKDEFIDTFINVRLKNRVHGDKAEVWVTEILKKYKFPVFENEKFLGESFVWLSISGKYKMFFKNKIIYITEYLEGGLTNSGRKLKIECPKGGIANSNLCLNKDIGYKEKIKNGLLYICYSFFDKRKISNIIEKSSNKILVVILLVPGYLLYKYWKIKY